MSITFAEKHSIWSEWRWQINIPESNRKGIPRGESVPIGGTKFLVAASMILYPRGLDLNGTADLWEKSSSLVAKWRTEEGFRVLVKKLEESFAFFVLQRMTDEKFLRRFQYSSREIDYWSDNVLHILIHNLAETIKKQTGEKDIFYLAKEWMGLEYDVPWLNLPLPKRTKTILTVDLIAPPKKSDEMLIWQDILSAAVQSCQQYPWEKTGPKPKKKADLVREKFDTVRQCLSAVEEGKISGQGARNYAKTALSALEDLGRMLNIKRAGE